MLNIIFSIFKRNNKNIDDKVSHTLLFKEQFKYLKTTHLYHLVDPSLWPILAALGAFMLTSGGVLYMHKFVGGWSLFVTGFCMIFYVKYIWCRDIVKEAIFTNIHTVPKILRLGMIFFILFEMMVFFAFFSKITLNNTIQKLMSFSIFKNKKNKKSSNLWLRNICDNFILFNYSVIVKQINSFLVIMPIMFFIIFFQSFILLKIYILVILISAAFMDLCYQIPMIGKPVCSFLKRYATPEIFALIGNSPFEAFFAKISGPALKNAAVPAAKMIGLGLTLDYAVSTTGTHQLASHMFQDAYNGEKTYYVHDHSLNRKPYLDHLIINGTSNSK